MICGWLKKVGFVSQKSIQYNSLLKRTEKSLVFHLYSITAKGSHALRQAQGNSSNSKREKFVMWEFLGSVAK